MNYFIDEIDAKNHGAHMMAKQILKVIKNNKNGRFSESLANEIIDLFYRLKQENKRLKENNNKIYNLCNGGYESQYDCVYIIEKIKEIAQKAKEQSNE